MIVHGVHMRTRFSHSIQAGISAGAMLLGLLAGCSPSKPAQPEQILVRTTRAESLQHVQKGGEASYIAMVKADTETDLSFKVGGIVDIIGPEPGKDWDEGTMVKAGTVLAGLKKADFTNALNTARANAELAAKTLERSRKLRATDAISPQELDIAEANSRAAQSQLSQAEQNLRDSELRAGIDGVVLSRYVNSSATVGAGSRVLRFADTRFMSVELGVPDRLVSRFVPGNEIEVEISALEAYPLFRGRVSEVAVAANSETRLFRVVLKVPNPDRLIRSGMTATIRVGELSQFGPGAVRVPLSALVTSPPANSQAGEGSSQLAVFVVEGQNARLRSVRTGDILGSSIVVLEGLKAGEPVVTAGASFLYDGAPVRAEAETSVNGD